MSDNNILIAFAIHLCTRQTNIAKRCTLQCNPNIISIVGNGMFQLMFIVHISNHNNKLIFQLLGEFLNVIPIFLIASISSGIVS